MNPEDQALARYTQHYHNDTYRAVQIALVRDVCGDYQADVHPLLERALQLTEIQRVMHLLTDTALEMCGHPFMHGRVHLLVGELLDISASATTMRLVSQHLNAFEKEHGTFCTDFENTALALLHLRHTVETLTKVTQHTAHIHHPMGNIAHDLLYSAHFLLQTAQWTLKGEPNLTYLGEKVSRAEQLLATAKHALKLKTP